MGSLYRVTDRLGGRRVTIGVGLLYVLAALLFPTTGPAGDMSATDIALTSFLTGASGVIVSAGGYLLPRTDIRADLYYVVAGWCLRAIGVMAGILVFLWLVTQMTTLVVNLAILTGLAGVAGLSMGYHDGKAKTRAVDAEEYSRKLERYESITEAVEDGVYALDSDEQFVLVNDAFCKMTGYDREELLGRHASVVHSDQINERAAALSAEQEETLGSATLEFDLRTSDGGTIPVESRFGPYEYDEGVARTGVVRDITDRKRFEETLTALYDSSRAFLGAETKDEVSEIVVETVTDTLDLSGVVTYLYDDEDDRLLPTVRSMDVGFMREELPAVPPDDSSITGHAYATGEVLRFDDIADSPHLQTTATEMQAGVFAPMGDHGVLVVGSTETGAFDDRTRKLVELLAATAEAAYNRVDRGRELQAQNDRLESFASMLAHELRNPVTIGQIYGQQLPAEANPEAVEYVTEAFDRMEAMIDVLLVLARGREAVSENATVQLADAARAAWDVADTADARLEVEIDAEIQADETYIRHLFRNLFENAVQHGGRDVTVTVGDLPTGFYVADDGDGIPLDEREAVFEPGYTTASGQGGTGLGLAFVRELADVYGWECSVTENANGGARFEFEHVTRTPRVTE